MGKKKKENIQDKEKDDLFDFSDEIIIGINSTKVLQEKKKKQKQDKKKTKENEKIKQASKISKAKQIKQPKNIQQAQKINKKNLKIKKILKWSILILVLIAAIICFLMSPLFNIKQIEINGEEKISEQTIADLSGITIEQNIFRFSKISAKENIMKNPYISSVEIDRLLPNHIVITISERTATYLIKLNDSYIYIDNQGYILEISEEKLELPIITSFEIESLNINIGDRLNKDDLKKLEQVIIITGAFKSNDVFDRIISIDVSDTSNFTVIMTDNKTVHLGDTNNLNVKMLFLKKILESEEGIEGEVFLEGKNNKEIYFRETIQEVNIE